MGLVVTVMTATVFVHTLHLEEPFVFQMGHFPAPWGNEISVGPLESLLATVFCIILYFSVFGGYTKLVSDIRESKRNLYFVLINLVQVSILALLYTNDMFTAYVFIEISTLASCGLMMIRQIVAASSRHRMELVIRQAVAEMATGSGQRI